MNIGSRCDNRKETKVMNQNIGSKCDNCKVTKVMNLLRRTSLAQSVCGERDEAREYDRADELRPLKARCKE